MAGDVPICFSAGTLHHQSISENPRFQSTLLQNLGKSFTHPSYNLLVMALDHKGNRSEVCFLSLPPGLRIYGRFKQIDQGKVSFSRLLVLYIGRSF